MYEKWYQNEFGVISLRGPPRGPIFFWRPLKNAKIYSFWARTMVFTSKWTIFSPGIQWEGSLGSWKSVLYKKRRKIYPNVKIPEIFGFLDLGLSLEPDIWLYLFGHGISQTQPMWGHTQNLNPLSIRVKLSYFTCLQLKSNTKVRKFTLNSAHHMLQPVDYRSWDRRVLCSENYKS